MFGVPGVRVLSAHHEPASLDLVVETDQTVEGCRRCRLCTCPVGCPDSAQPRVGLPRPARTRIPQLPRLPLSRIRGSWAGRLVESSVEITLSRVGRASACYLFACCSDCSSPRDGSVAITMREVSGPKLLLPTTPYLCRWCATWPRGEASATTSRCVTVRTCDRSRDN